jgi:DNA-binding XRE family transcriptional regulator
MQAKRRTSQVDDEVGRRVRLRRMQLRMSQADLANSLGITFQQIQKYEKRREPYSGWTPSEDRGIPGCSGIVFFGQGADESKDKRIVMDFLNSAYALRLLQAFSRIRDKKLQQTLLAVVERVADNDKR